MIHHVFANRSNAGDWLSAIGIQQLLASGAEGVVEHLCDAPFVPETIARLGRAGADDFIVLGGGGLFMNYFSPFWRDFLPIARRVPFAIWGVGACDIINHDSLPPRDLVREIVSLSRLCVVRDELTREFIGSDNLQHAPVPCPTINALENRAAAAPAGIVLHVDHYENVGAENFERMERFAARFAASSGRRHSKTNNLLPAGRRSELEKIIALYAAADLVLTSRLHGCIIAAALGRPFLAVTGDRKIDSFMRAAGLEKWLCPLEEIDSIPDRFARLDRERPSASAFVAQSRKDNQSVATEVLELLKTPLA
ncbi:MAG: polysaccharide pyruvyl transferase family protein [Opitutaceae bacterium]